MKLDMKSLLKDKNVLYAVLCIALLNLFGYLMLRDLDAVLFFMSLGFLTTYFSKNMIVVMIVAMLGTNLLVAIRRPLKEGMDNKKEKKKKTNDVEENTKDEAEDVDEELEDEEATGRKPKLDYASTLEKAYDNLDQLLGSDAIKQMSDRTQNLAQQQSNLMETMKNMEPMMDQAAGMLQKLNMNGDMGGMMDKMMGKLQNLTAQQKNIQPPTEKEEK